MLKVKVMFILKRFNRMVYDRKKVRMSLEERGAVGIYDIGEKNYGEDNNSEISSSIRENGSRKNNNLMNGNNLEVIIINLINKWIINLIKQWIPIPIPKFNKNKNNLILFNHLKSK